MALERLALYEEAIIDFDVAQSRRGAGKAPTGQFRGYLTESCQRRHQGKISQGNMIWQRERH
jgi:hypothetical protein